LGGGDAQAGLAAPLFRSFLTDKMAKKRFKGKKWKYAGHARKFRRCERCFGRLQASEAHMCHACFAEMLGNTEVQE